MGRLVPPALFGDQVPIYSLKEISEMESPRDGLFVVDASEIIDKGAFGLDQNNPLVDYTIGWFDLMGAHSDFKNPEAAALLSWFANSAPYNLP